MCATLVPTPGGAMSMDASCCDRLRLIAIAASVSCGGSPASKPPPASAPEVSAAPAAGAYRPPLQLTLSCVGHGSPCEAILYTLDGSAPGAGASTYTGPITLTESATVRFVGRDRAGQ